MSPKLVIAHRGVPGYVWENTLDSFEKAIELGADAIEFDIRRTRDGYYVAHHDEAIDGQLLGELTYSKLDALALARGFHVPTLEEILTLAQGRIQLDVELKEPGYEREIVDCLLQFYPTGQFMITSFHDCVLKTIKQHYPDIKVGLLLGIAKPKNAIATRLSELFPDKRAANIEADFLVPHYQLLQLGFLTRARNANKPVLVWTVNEPGMLEKYLQHEQIAGVITDWCDRAVELRSRARNY